MNDIIHWIQLGFHAVPIFIAAIVWYEHEKWKKSIAAPKIKEYATENNKMTFTILKLLLFITIYLSADTFLSLHVIQKDSKAANTNTEKLLASIEKLESIKQNTDKLLTNSVFPDIDNIKEKFNPVLAKTFSSYIEENAQFFNDGINSGKVTFHMDRFLTAYTKSLEYLNDKYASLHPTLYATSLTSGNYFWSYGNQPLRPTEIQIRDFIKKGGYIKRIFFVEDNWESDSVAVSVLNRQIDSLGVNEVYLLNQKYIPLKKYFVVNKEKEFMWDLIITSRESIDYGTYSTNKNDIETYTKMFDDLLNNPNTQKFTKK